MDYLNGYYELYHHGILGQKWGVRRYQNPDGSLTAEGKLRYKIDPKTGKYKKLNYREQKRARAKYEAEKKAEAAKKNKSPREKKITELTDKQLDKYINRMQKEERAIQLRNSINKLDPRPLTRGERFMNLMMDEVVIPTVREVGKEALKRMLNNALKTNNGNSNNKNNNNGGGGKGLSDNQKKQAKKLRDQGKSYEEIAKGFQGIDAETVKNYLSNNK